MRLQSPIWLALAAALTVAAPTVVNQDQANDEVPDLGRGGVPVSIHVANTPRVTQGGNARVTVVLDKLVTDAGGSMVELAYFNGDLLQNPPKGVKVEQYEISKTYPLVTKANATGTVRVIASGKKGNLVAAEFEIVPREGDDDEPVARRSPRRGERQNARRRMQRGNQRTPPRAEGGGDQGNLIVDGFDLGIRGGVPVSIDFDTYNGPNTRNVTVNGTQDVVVNAFFRWAGGTYQDGWSGIIYRDDTTIPWTDALISPPVVLYTTSERDSKWEIRIDKDTPTMTIQVWPSANPMAISTINVTNLSN